MTKLIYITHPSVEITSEIPIDEWDLSESGIESCYRLLEFDFWKEVDYIYTSNEPKSYQVAEIIQEKYQDLIYEKRKNFGEADRTSTGLISPPEEYMEVVQQAYNNIALGVMGWESHLDMMVRNAKELDSVKENHQDKTFVIIGHGGAGTTMKCYIKGILPNFSEDPQKTGCFFLADLDKSEIISEWERY